MWEPQPLATLRPSTACRVKTLPIRGSLTYLHRQVCIVTINMDPNSLVMFMCISADYITPCSKKDPKFNECALKHGREAIPRIIKGTSSECTFAQGPHKLWDTPVSSRMDTGISLLGTSPLAFIHSCPPLFQIQLCVYVTVQYYKD
jgi:hypothetical protein